MLHRCDCEVLCRTNVLGGLVRQKSPEGRSERQKQNCADRQARVSHQRSLPHSRSPVMLLFAVSAHVQLLCLWIT